MGLDNPIHIAFVLVLVLLVFGAKRLPELGRSLGSGMRGFKESISGESTPHETPALIVADDTPAAPVAAAPTAPVAAPVAVAPADHAAA
jgi:sec-independent protein translocase protein TatA